MRFLAALANAVQIQRVVGELHLVFLGDGFLPLLDHLVDEFHHLAALQTDQVIVVAAVVEFEHGMAAFEMVAQHEAGLFELGQHPVHRGEANVIALFQQGLVDVFGAHVTAGRHLEDLQDFHPGQGDLEAGFLELLVIHALLTPGTVAPCTAARRSGVAGGGLLLAGTAVWEPVGVQLVCLAVAAAGIPVESAGFPPCRALSSCAPVYVMKLRPLLVSALLVCLSGCSFIDWLTYKLPVNQGNIIEQKDIDKLKPGMTREQVVFVLGEPLARSSFQGDRWEYVYTSVAGREVYPSKRISVLFANEQLASISGEGFLIPEGLGVNKLSPAPAATDTPPATETPPADAPAATDTPAANQ